MSGGDIGFEKGGCGLSTDGYKMSARVVIAEEQ